MLKKNKKFTLLLSGLSGALLVSSAAGVALSSCSTTSSSSSSDVQYSYVIDWNNEAAVERLIVDENGLVYSDNSMTTIIAVSPKVKLTTVKIPSKVKSIMGYSKVMYKDSSGNLYDQIPSDGTDTYTKVYESYGAFQGMESLETVVLESSSNLQSIGGKAFYGCTTLKNVTNLSSSLNYIGTLAFTNCTNLQAINTSNVVSIGDGAFTNCTSLTTVDLSSAIHIGNYAFQSCTGLTSVGSLEQVRTLGISTFQSAFSSESSITLKLTNLTYVPTSAFESAQGITKVDFSGNTLLTYLDTGAFMSSSVTEVDFTGCSKLARITERSFKGCTNLTTVYLPADSITSLTTIGSNTFLNCTNLTTVGVSGTKTGFVATSKLSTIGADFLAYTAITSVDLSNFAISSSNSSSNPFGSQFSLSFISNLASVTLPSTITTLNAGLFYGSGLNSTSGFSLTLPSSITDLVYDSSTTTITDPSSSTSESVSNLTPFTNSGVGTIDMSKITSYQTSATTTIPAYLFNGATKLTSVVLKAGTTVISDYAFQGTTALTSITYPSSSDTATTADTNGFTASEDLTSIGTGAFYSAFSADAADITVDLKAMTSLTTTPAAFNESNVTTLKLPTSIVTIAADSFDEMTKLSSVNFEELTLLTTIYKKNFNNTKLTSIDLSTTKFSKISGSTSSNLFTGLPTNCVVSLPSTAGSFKNVFTDTSGAYVTFSYPNGISSSLFTISSAGVLTFNSSNNTSLITNANVLNLSSFTTATTIGTSTFFGVEKLTTLTLPASVSTFAAGSSITANTNNTDAASSQYVTANVPFGSNEAFTSLNYTGFTSVSGTEDTDSKITLFNKTSTDTWNEIVNIINSLSYQASATTSETAAATTANMSTWAAGSTESSSSVINTDAVRTWTAATSSKEASVALSNSYASSSSTSGVTINASDSTATIIHNGVTWTYTNNGSSITLTGQANMYKATTGSDSYLVFFNQTTYSVTSGSTYYVPSKTPVKVTLTIATA